MLAHLKTFPCDDVLFVFFERLLYQEKVASSASPPFHFGGNIQTSGLHVCTFKSCTFKVAVRLGRSWDLRSAA